jgi:AefR-like transcriptional repressor, C-terminal domain
MARFYGRPGTAVDGDGRDQEREGGHGQAGAQGVGPVPGLPVVGPDRGQVGGGQGDGGQLLVHGDVDRHGDQEGGHLRVDDPSEAFRLLYGLVVQDLQIRVLLGEPPPGPTALATQARVAVERFLALTAPK